MTPRIVVNTRTEPIGMYFVNLGSEVQPAAVFALDSQQ